MENRDDRGYSGMMEERSRKGGKKRREKNGSWRTQSMTENT